MRQSKDKQNEQVLKKTILLSGVLFTLVCAFLATGVVLFHHVQSETLLTGLKNRERTALDLHRTAIDDEFDSIAGDLLLLSRQNELLGLRTSPDRAAIQAIQAEFIALASVKRMYDQIRYLDATGMERVRVNYNQGEPAAVPDNRLQDKSGRSYFQRSIVLDQGRVFASALDLNVEYDRVETPFKPMIRFATPVFGDQGRKQGVVVLNYLADHLLSRIRDAGEHGRGERILLNAEGHWLLSPRTDEEWRFMFPDKSDATFAKAFPQEWEAMLEQGDGSVRTENGLYTFITIKPLRQTLHSFEFIRAGDRLPCRDAERYFWVLATHVPPEVLDSLDDPLVRNILLFGGGLFGFSIVATWILSLSIVKRRAFQARILRMARFDNLTDLPNRTLFFDRLNMAMEHAKRHEHRTGLLYVDLDGFKAVNDTMGHHAGDELLVRVAEILRACSRKSDTVARLGGDEFAVVLFEIRNVQDARQVADKIIKALSEPMTLQSSTVLIGASIGAAVYPDHADTDEDLVKAADKAMYRAKQRGKNNCVAAGD